MKSLAKQSGFGESLIYGIKSENVVKHSAGEAAPVVGEMLSDPLNDSPFLFLFWILRFWFFIYNWEMELAIF